MKANWQDYIESTPDVIRGKPRFKGTRIPVSLILGYLADGAPHADILAEFPGLEEIHIAAALDFARDLADSEAAA